jgi:hypothetical protein
VYQLTIQKKLFAKAHYFEALQPNDFRQENTEIYFLFLLTERL